MLNKIRQWARQLKHKLTALYYAQQHPATPWYCKALIFLTLLYALSPLDLIPDFIPVLGLLDDLLLLPLAIFFTVKLLPPGLWLECQAKAERSPLRLPRQKAGIILVLMVWALLLLLLWHYWLQHIFQSSAT